MKRTVIAILIALLVVAIGGVLLFAGLSAVRFNVKDLDKTTFVTSHYDFDGPVREIDVEGRTVDVALLPAENGRCRVVCTETEREKYTVTLADGTLTVRPAEEGRLSWTSFLSLFKSPKLTVYLPAGSYERLKVTLSTGDVAADRSLAFGQLEVELSTGDLTLSGVRAETVTVRGRTGDVHLSDMTPKTAAITLSTGDVTLTNVVCSGDLRCETSTGDIRLTDVDGANLYLKASTGDVTGTVLTDKTFVTDTSTGKVSVPATAASGRCEVRTSTGDIRISVNGK